MAGTLLRWSEARLARHIDAIVAVSDTVARNLAARWGIDVQVIPNPVDVEAIRRAAAQPLTDPPAGTDLDTTVIAFIGRLAPEKGPDLFLAIARELAARHPAWQFWIVGDGAMRLKLTAQVDDDGLAARVRFWGERTDVYAVMARADVVALPSRREAFGSVALEARVLGLPVVAFNAGGIADTLRDSPGARLVPAGDVSTFARALEEAVDGGTPGPMVADRYQADTIAAQWAHLYRAVSP
jgi:glycosyltransferase involved in cell wall biosynthesis